MPFMKFASAAEILGLAGSADKIRTASLTKFSEYDKYRTDDGYLYVRVRAISSRVNKNHDAWSSDELAKSYRTFIGKPLFVDHHNDDPSKARGAVVDAVLHVEDLEKTASSDPFYATAEKEFLPPTWVELLLEVDAKTYPKLAKAIINGDIDGVSMGANVERSRCSHCDNWARSPEEYCKHIVAKGAYFDYTRNGVKTSKRSFEYCHDIGFFELSFVFDPADETAYTFDVKTARRQNVKQAVYHEAAMPSLMQGDPGGSAGGPSSALDMHGGNPGLSGHFQALMDLVGPEKANQLSGMFQQALGSFNSVDNAVGYVHDQVIAEGYAPHMAQEIVNILYAHQGADAQLPANDIPEFATSVEELPPNDIEVGWGNDPIMSKTADRNPLPQSDMTIAPEKVDSLRKEQVCPICGSTMEDGTCEVCFTPETMIRTRAGYLPIAAIEIGDEVLSSDGKFHRVLEVMETPYDGLLYEITTHSSVEPIRVTPQHPFMALMSKHTSQMKTPCRPGRCGRSGSYIGHDKHGNVNVDHWTDWVEAQSLTTDSFLALNAPTSHEDRETISVPEEFRGKRQKTGAYVRRGPVDFELTPDFLWMIGLFLAEGSSGDRSINFALHQDEMDYVDRLRPLFESLGYTTGLKTKKNNKGVWLNVYSSTLAEWFPHWLGHGCENKHIPSEILSLPLEKLDHVIQGVLDGDGGKTHQKLFAQTSPILAMQVTEHSLRHGRTPTLSFAKPVGKRPYYSVNGTVAVEQKQRKKKFTWVLGQTHLTQVKSINQVPYWGSVFNLRVEDDPTYTVQNLLVHNCNYVEEPEGFDNPNLEKAKEVDEQADRGKEMQVDQLPQQEPTAIDAQPGASGQPSPTPGSSQGPMPMQSSMQKGSPYPKNDDEVNHSAPGHHLPEKVNEIYNAVKRENPDYDKSKAMAIAWSRSGLKHEEASNHESTSQGISGMSKWQIITKTASGPSGGRINTQEQTILPAPRQPSDKPANAKVVKDSVVPVESKTKETNMSTQKHADGTGATPAGSGVSAEKRVDVEGIGSVMDNPESGTEHTNVEKEVNIEKIHTDTWHGNEGDSLGQHDPVTREVGSEGMNAPIGQPVSHVVTADGTWGDPGEGSGKGFPDHEPTRVDLESGLLEEVGDPTMTWSGTDGNKVYRQEEPVTNELGSGGMNAPIGEALPTKSLRSHIFRSMKLAETEVELGLTDPEQKWNRAAELEESTPNQLDSVEATLARVKTAGLRKRAAATGEVKTANRMPSLQPTSAVPSTGNTVDLTGAEELFGR